MVIGETGSGKTTQITQYLAEEVCVRACASLCVHAHVRACVRGRHVCARKRRAACTGCAPVQLPDWRALNAVKRLLIATSANTSLPRCEGLRAAVPSHACLRARANGYGCAVTHGCTRTRWARAHTRSHAYTQTRTHARTLTHRHARKHTHTHTHTRTHTQLRLRDGMRCGLGVADVATAGRT